MTPKFIGINQPQFIPLNEPEAPEAPEKEESVGQPQFVDFGAPEASQGVSDVLSAPSSWDIFKAGFDREDFFGTNVGKMLSARMLNTTYNEETGETGWDLWADDKTYEQNLEATRKEKMEQLKKDHPNVIGTQYEDSSEFILGRMATTLVDPAFLAAPVGGSVLKAAAIGGGIGAIDSAVWQHVDQGEVDGKHVAIAAALGTVLGGGLKWGVDSLSKAIKQRGINSMRTRLEGVGDDYMKGVKGGLEHEASLEQALKNNQILDMAEYQQLQQSLAALSPDAVAARELTEQAISVSNRDPKVRKAVVNSIAKLSNRVMGENNTAKAATAINGTVKYVGTGLQKALVPVRTVIQKHDRVIANKLAKMEGDLHMAQQHWRDRVGEKKIRSADGTEKSFGDWYHHLSSADKDKFDKFVRWHQGSRVDLAGAKKKLEQELGIEARQHYENVRNIIDEISMELEKAGVLPKGQKEFRRIAGYWPRAVDDYDGLVNKLRGEEGIAAEIEAQVEAAKAYYGRDLNPDEMARAVNDAFDMRSKARTDYKSSQKKRGIHTNKDKYGDDLGIDQFYADSAKSLSKWIDDSMEMIHQRQFFGVYGNPEIQKLGKSIDNLVWGKEGSRLTSDGKIEVSRVLTARFGKGQKAMNKSLANARDVMYAMTLGHVKNTITQFGDVGISMIINGFRNTAMAIVDRVRTGKWAKRADEMGILRISKDFADPVTAHIRVRDIWKEVFSSHTKWADKPATALNAVFRTTGFQSVDQFGKNVLLNSSLRKYRKMAKTQKGREEFKKTFGGMYTDAELNKHLDDLATYKGPDDLTHAMKTFMFHDLSEAQPITRSEMPEYYLNHPNGRIFYMLKTFTLKQFDIYHKRILMQAKDNPAKATENLLRAGMFLTMAGFGTDQVKAFIYDGELKDVDDATMNNLWKLVGLTSYAAQMIQKDPATGLLSAFITPPVSKFDDVANSLDDLKKAHKWVPLGQEAKALFSWFGVYDEE